MEDHEHPDPFPKLTEQLVKFLESIRDSLELDVIFILFFSGIWYRAKPYAMSSSSLASVLTEFIDNAKHWAKHLV